MKKNGTLIVGLLAAMVVLYLLFKPNGALAGSTAAVGSTANPNVTPLPANGLAAAGAVASAGLSNLLGAISSGLGVTNKTVAAIAANGGPQPLDPTAQSVSDALSEVQSAEDDPITQGVSSALDSVLYSEQNDLADFGNLFSGSDTLSDDLFDSVPVFDTSSSPGLDFAIDEPGATDA